MEVVKFVMLTLEEYIKIVKSEIVLIFLQYFKLIFCNKNKNKEGLITICFSIFLLPQMIWIFFWKGKKCVWVIFLILGIILFEKWICWDYDVSKLKAFFLFNLTAV